MRTSLSLAISVLVLSLVLVSISAYEYVPKSMPNRPQNADKFSPGNIGIQGTIYCKSGPKYLPLKDAVARISCVAVNKKGYETAPFSILSSQADAKGYFFAALSASEVEEGWKLKECKVFLDKSPLKECNVPSDVNKGVSGAPLAYSKSRLLKHLNLYSVGPFFYTPPSTNPNSVSKGY